MHGSTFDRSPGTSLQGMHYADCSQASFGRCLSSLGTGNQLVRARPGVGEGLVPGSPRSAFATTWHHILAQPPEAMFEPASEWLKANLHPMSSSKFNI